MLHRKWRCRRVTRISEIRICIEFSVECDHGQALAYIHDQIPKVLGTVRFVLMLTETYILKRQCLVIAIQSPNVKHRLFQEFAHRQGLASPNRPDRLEGGNGSPDIRFSPSNGLRHIVGAPLGHALGRAQVTDGDLDPGIRVALVYRESR